MNKLPYSLLSEVNAQGLKGVSTSVQMEVCTFRFERVHVMESQATSNLGRVSRETPYRITSTLATLAARVLVVERVCQICFFLLPRTIIDGFEIVKGDREGEKSQRLRDVSEVQLRLCGEYVEIQVVDSELLDVL